MAKHAQPWYRVGRDAWFVTLGGRQHRLARGKANEAEAYKRFHALMLSQGQTTASDPGITVEHLNTSRPNRSMNRADT